MKAALKKVEVEQMTSLWALKGFWVVPSPTMTVAMSSKVDLIQIFGQRAHSIMVQWFSTTKTVAAAQSQTRLL